MWTDVVDVEDAVRGCVYYARLVTSGFLWAISFPR